MTTRVKGLNNEVTFLQNGIPMLNTDVEGLTISVNGNDNRVIIELPSKFINTSVVIEGDNNRFHLKSTKGRSIRHTSFGMEGGSEIVVGTGLSSYRDNHLVAKGGKNIYVGDECMFAREIMIRNEDGHIILDKNTNEVINAPEDIIIEDNVWLGMRSILLKGTIIKKGSIVGAMSLVNRKFDEENIIIAGVPAKKIRSNVEWRRENYSMYLSKKEQDNWSY